MCSHQSDARWHRKDTNKRSVSIIHETTLGGASTKECLLSQIWVGVFYSCFFYHVEYAVSNTSLLKIAQISTLLSKIRKVKLVLKSYRVTANSLKEFKTKYGFVTDRDRPFCLLSLRFHLASGGYTIDMSKWNQSVHKTSRFFNSLCNFKTIDPSNASVRNKLQHLQCYEPAILWAVLNVGAWL